MEDDIKLYHGDSLEVVRQMPDGSVDLVLTDPPYNIGLRTQTAGRRKYNDWDRIDDYISWCISWLRECQRVLKPNGVLYFWHSDMRQIADLLVRIQAETDLALVSFCIWDKGNGYRAQAWHNRRPDGKTAPRSWFSVCEYCLHFFNNPRMAGRRQSCEEQRNTHICDPMHCNIWHEPPIPSNKRYHTCQKPTSILGRLINVSSRPGGIVFDPFMGSGSTGVACLETGRKFIGGERDERTFNTAQKRIADYKAKQEVKRYE